MVWVENVSPVLNYENDENTRTAETDFVNDREKPGRSNPNLSSSKSFMNPRLPTNLKAFETRLITSMNNSLPTNQNRAVIGPIESLCSSSTRREDTVILVNNFGSCSTTQIGIIDTLNTPPSTPIHSHR